MEILEPITQYKKLNERVLQSETELPEKTQPNSCGLTPKINNNEV